MLRMHLRSVQCELGLEEDPGDGKDIPTEENQTVPTLPMEVV